MNGGNEAESNDNQEESAPEPVQPANPTETIPLETPDPEPLKKSED